ncbi:MAG: flagellar hook capping FlgD N-terminal domain-containing protein [Eubacteriales bacterium]|nr:flagellar hook capping FlgD N-terminal domain-containing protein [Eubacteriales bacterium]
MSIESLNNYTAVRSADTSNSSTGLSSTALTMQDFFSLMVAELSNQDMYNTMDNTQYISQLAQFSMMQAISDLSETFSKSFSDLSLAYSTSYSVGLIGKEVTLAKTDNAGNISTYRGIVQSVNLFNGNAEVVVDGKAYVLSSVMKVNEPDIIIPDSSINANRTAVDKADETDGMADSIEKTDGLTDSIDETDNSIDAAEKIDNSADI